MALSKSASSDKYTRPELREKLKEKIQAGDKGGRKGQWSARKSQLLAQEYKKQGGGYRGGKGKGQNSLDKWTGEHWQTSSGSERARHGKETDRYLPEKAWKDLTPAQKRATNRKKQAASRKGKQFVSNTGAAKKARRTATGK